MNRAEILDAARKCVSGDREEDYGSPEDNFEDIGLNWGVYLRAAHPELKMHMAVNAITPKDVAMMLAGMKQIRAARGRKADNYVDLAGYAACAGEIDGSPRMEIAWTPKEGDRVRISKTANVPEGIAGRPAKILHVPRLPGDLYDIVCGDSRCHLHSFEIEKV